MTQLLGFTQLQIHWPGEGQEPTPEALTRARVEAVLEPLHPWIRAFGKLPGISGYEGAVTQLSIAPPGHEAVGRAWQGIGSSQNCVVVQLTFSRSDAFLSTDRAARPAPLRLPVSDRYEALLELPVPGADGGSSGPWMPSLLASPLRVRERRSVLRLTPFSDALEYMARLQEFPRFQALLMALGTVPFGTRLELPAPLQGPSEVGEASPPALGKHLLSRLVRHLPARLRLPLETALSHLPQEDSGSLPKIEPYPPRQLKFYLDQWLPRGEYRLDTLYPEVARMPAEAVQLDSDGMAFTVEFIEGTTPRHVQQRFRGTWVHSVVTRDQVAAWEERRV